MSDIAPLGFSQAHSPANAAAAGSAAVDGIHSNGSAAARHSSSNGTITRRDKVEISQAAHYLSKLHDLPDVRQDLVDNVRGQIANGTYETSAKIDAAVDALEYDL